MLVIHLIKKNLLLIKEQIPLLIIVLTIAVVYLGSKLQNDFIIFFIMTAFFEYFTYSAVSTKEEIFRCDKYLCVTPYTRKQVVKSKYAFINFIFIINLLMYVLISQIFKVVHITAISILAVFSLVNLFFSLFIPIEYRFGYNKSKYILMLLFIIPTWGMEILFKSIGFSDSNYLNMLHKYVNFNIIAIIITIFAIVISSKISYKLYSKKDL